MKIQNGYRGKWFVYRESFDISLRDGAIQSVIILITNKLIPQSGRYASSKHLKVVVVKLRDYGVEKEIKRVVNGATFKLNCE